MRSAWTSAALWRLATLLVLLLVSLVAALTVDLPGAVELRERIDSYGWGAPVVFVGLYALITLAPVPKNVLSAVAGLVFGLVAGSMLVWVAAMVGALVSFGLGRWLGRDAVERFTSTRVQRVDDLVASRGLLAVILVRLVPVAPFTAINYAAGLTGVQLWHYAVGTAVGIVPGTVAYVALGTYGDAPGSLPFVLSVAALVVLSAGGLILARRRRWGAALPVDVEERR